VSPAKTSKKTKVKKAATKKATPQKKSGAKKSGAKPAAAKPAARVPNAQLCGARPAKRIGDALLNLALHVPGPKWTLKPVDVTTDGHQLCWRMLERRAGDLLVRARPADCAACGLTREETRGREMLRFVDAPGGDEFAIPSPILEWYDSSRAGRASYKYLRCVACVDPCTGFKVVAPEDDKGLVCLHHIEEKDPKGKRILRIVAFMHRQTNYAVEALIKSRDPKDVADKLSSCACFRSTLFLAAASKTDDGRPKPGGHKRLWQAFGGGHAAHGGEVFRDGLRLATNVELKAAGVSPSDKRHFQKFYAFQDHFIQQGAPWISPTTILASEGTRGCEILKVYFATCPITGITVKWDKNQKHGAMELHHVSKQCRHRLGRTFDYFFGILHRTANSALSLFTLKESR
jgi:hypothetical protein